MGEDSSVSSMVRGDAEPEFALKTLPGYFRVKTGGLYTPLDAKGSFGGATVMLMLSRGIFRTKSVVNVMDSLMRELDMDCLITELKKNVQYNIRFVRK